ncbi:MAG TPA: vitamin K epoxide reductase family protein [Gemmatimonadaceae bacterium]|nr:vitamin K epoxide reductase family protein [Gemmatimonadaceae bacterium]
MTKRMVIALLALVGALVSTYLALFNLGIIGELTCSVGSCQKVQASEWSSFLGLPVAAWGVGFYLATLAVALAGVQPRLEESRRVSLVLAVLTGWGVLFSAWLTYLELFVIREICQWCVASAVIVVGMFILSILDVRENSEPRTEQWTGAGEVTPSESGVSPPPHPRV